MRAGCLRRVDVNRRKVISRGIQVFAAGGAVAGMLGGGTVRVAQAGQQLPPPPPPVGAPLPAITLVEQQKFDSGRTVFGQLQAPVNGLGPVFNARSCVACHRAGAPGGAGTDLNIARVTRIGGIVNGVYSDLTNVGGPVLEARSLREIDPLYPYPGERVPVEAQFVSRRITTPLFGAGLIEAIPDSTIIANSQRLLPDGIHGVPNMVLNPESGRTQVGRFGWKCQVPIIHLFSGDAFLNEIGITSPTFPKDNLPQGRTDSNGADKAPDAEDNNTKVAAVSGFTRYLAPPPPVPFTPTSQRGQQVFNSIQCAACHMPVMQTGFSGSAAIANKPVHLWSDLLLHHMGRGLADGVRQGQAAGDMWRTAPLWGLRFRPLLLHDGRATTVEQAIVLHDGESKASRDRYVNLPLSDKQALLDFLSKI